MGGIGLENRCSDLRRKLEWTRSTEQRQRWCLRFTEDAASREVLRGQRAADAKRGEDDQSSRKLRRRVNRRKSCCLAGCSSLGYQIVGVDLQALQNGCKAGPFRVATAPVAVMQYYSRTQTAKNCDAAEYWDCRRQVKSMDAGGKERGRHRRGKGACPCSSCNAMLQGKTCNCHPCLAHSHSLAGSSKVPRTVRQGCPAAIFFVVITRWGTLLEATNGTRDRPSSGPQEASPGCCLQSVARRAVGGRAGGR